MSWYGTLISSRGGDTLIASDRPAAVWIIGGVLMLAGLVLIAAMSLGVMQGSRLIAQIARGAGAALTIAAGILLVVQAPLTRFVFPRRGRAMSIRRFWARGPETLLLERKEIETIAIEEQIDSDEKSRYWMSIRLRNGNVIRMTAQGMPRAQVDSMELVAAELRQWWSLPQPKPLPPFGDHAGIIIPASARRELAAAAAQVAESPPTAPAPRLPSPTPSSARLRLIG